VVEADPSEPLLPRLAEAVPGLGAVADDGQAPGRAAHQQHLPLGVGELLRLVHHDVGEGTGEQVRVDRGQCCLVDHRGLEVRAAQHRHHVHVRVVGLDQVVDHRGHPLALSGHDRLVPASPPRRLRVAEALAGGVQQREVRNAPGLGLPTLEAAYLVRLQPRGAPAQVRRHGPQVAHEVGRLDQRPGPAEGVSQVAVAAQRPAELLGRDLLVVVLVHQEGEELLPDLVAGLVVRRTGVGGVERLRPLVGAQPQVRPGGLDLHALGGRLLVETYGGLDGGDHRGRRLEAGDLGIGLGRGGGTLRDEVAQGARLDALLTEAREHVGDISEVGLVGSDEQHAAPAMAQARVGVEQVRRAVQRDDRLAGARPSVDDQRPSRPRPDDGVLVGGDRAEHVPHPG
jgi:hypothetical protein